jgi:hypothetical protein
MALDLRGFSFLFDFVSLSFFLFDFDDDDLASCFSPDDRLSFDLSALTSVSELVVSDLPDLLIGSGTGGAEFAFGEVTASGFAHGLPVCTPGTGTGVFSVPLQEWSADLLFVIA